MTEHYNIKSLTERRRSLRKNLPKAEAVPWTPLSRRQMCDAKFRRQYSVDQHVIDFYCPKLKLAIEVDGESHFADGAEEYDQERQMHIEGFGITFLRFLNTDISENLDGVLQAIADKISELRAKSRTGLQADGQEDPQVCEGHASTRSCSESR
jgi:very-short-patch-repair endonuclease